MIITYARCDNEYNTFLFVPDTIPWKLTAEIDCLTEGTNDNPDDYQVDYVLKLVTGAGMEEIMMLSEELWGCFPDKVDEEKEILALFNYIIDEAASDLAYALSNGQRVFDLGETISRCKDEWIYHLERAPERGDDNEK